MEIHSILNLNFFIFSAFSSIDFNINLENDQNMTMPRESWNLHKIYPDLENVISNHFRKEVSKEAI